MGKIEFKVKYEDGHCYPETWEKETYFCPRCGSKEVWVRRDEGDYCLGQMHLCIICNSVFYLPNGCESSFDQQTMQRVMNIVRNYE